MLVIDKDRWPRGWMQGQEATRAAATRPSRRYESGGRLNASGRGPPRLECVLLHIGQPDNCCCTLSRVAPAIAMKLVGLWWQRLRMSQTRCNKTYLVRCPSLLFEKPVNK